MTLEDLQRVCDDAERWNSTHPRSDSDSGFKAIEAVRKMLKESMKDWRGVYGTSVQDESS